ncbi:MAG: transcriptional regulator GcvA [Halieaceae bacterium]|nr:transcriptional regulator GcvA [Halieaceae bacterium]
MKLRRQKRKLPPLNALRAFEAAARYGSFKLAAEELSVSQSAISHQVRALEEYLGVHLFARKIRAVELNRKGAMYYPVLRDALDRISDATDLVVSDRLSTTLTVQVYSTFTIRWLLPRLAEFQRTHPNLQVRLHTSQDDVNFDQDDIDLAIMIGLASNSQLHYTHLFDSELFPVCSALYLEQHGDINDPLDLADHPILQVYPSAGDWHVWLDARGVDADVVPESGLQFESYDVALSSAAQGMGIGLGQQPYVAQDLAVGSLVELFPGRRVKNPNAWYLVGRHEKADLLKIQAFRSWLLQEVAHDSSLHGLTSR